MSDIFLVIKEAMTKAVIDTIIVCIVLALVALDLGWLIYKAWKKKKK